MFTERESLPELQKRWTRLDTGVSKVKSFMDKLGVTDVVPSLKLDPQNLGEYRVRLSRIREINEKLRDRTIPFMFSKRYEVAASVAGIVDEQVSLANEVLNDTQQAVSDKLLSESALDPLKDRVNDLNRTKDSSVYQEGHLVLEERRKTAEQIPAEPIMPIVPEEAEVIALGPATAPIEPEVTLEQAEKQRQIEAIREALGNAKSFDYPEEMSIDELFDQEIEVGKPFHALRNVLFRSQITSVEQLLNMTVEGLVGKAGEEKSGVRGFGGGSLEKTINQLQKHGILPRGLTVGEVPEEQKMEIKKYSKNARATFDVSFPDGNIKTIAGEARAEILRVLSEAPGNTLSISELTERVYGVDTKRFRSDLSGFISKINQLVDDWEIDQSVNAFQRVTGTEAVYTLRRKQSEIPEAQDDELMEANLAEIQRLANKGVLADAEQLRRIQDIARELGQDFYIYETTTPEAKKEEEFEYSTEEAAVLAKLILTRVEISIPFYGQNFTLSIAKDEAEALDKLVDAWRDYKVNGELLKIRDEVLDKTERLFRAENSDDLVLNNYQGDLREMLVALFYLDRTVEPSYLFDFLRSGLHAENFSNEVYDWVRRIIRAGQEPRVSVQAEVAKTEAIKFTPKVEVAEETTSTQPRLEIKELILPDMQEVEKIHLRERQIGEILSDAYDRDPDNLIPAEPLADTIWPDFTTEQKRKNLSVTLSGLRKTLRPFNWDWENLAEPYQEAIYRLVRNLDEGQNETVLSPQQEPEGPTKEPEIESEEITVEPVRNTPTRVVGAPTNSRGFERYVRSQGFQINHGGRGDMQVLDPDGQYVVSLTSRRAGGKTISNGVYRKAIKKIEERARQIEERDN